MRMTKIICTLGPAVDDDNLLEQLILGGMDVARLNFSHGTHAEQKLRVDRVKEIREKLNVPVPLLLDTKGPEIRLGKFKKGEVTLKENNAFVLVNENILGTDEKSTISHKELYKDVKVGTTILINDGLVAIKVQKVIGKDIHCIILNGGTVSNNKGVNIPETDTHLPAITNQDIEDIKFAIENGFDFIACSFVRKASNVIEVREILNKYGGQDLRIISKIENREGVSNFDEILKVSDGIMVARGDLGVEIPTEEVPIVQKMIIKKCYENGKPVITATQMLDSMIKNPRPTRAESSDVANAVYDGTSAIMLSGESAMGKYPIESVKTMVRIAQMADESIDYGSKLTAIQFDTMENITNAISYATCTIALQLKAVAIISATQSGQTARMISRFRASCPIIATTSNPRVQRQLSISWGVIPLLVGAATNVEEMFEIGVKKALDIKLVKQGDIIVITAGGPVGIAGTTNLLKVQTVGNILVKGVGLSKGKVSGEICVASSADQINENFKNGNILVLPHIDNDMRPHLKNASAIVVEGTVIDSHVNTFISSLDIPVIIGAKDAMNILKSGSVVTVDSNNGVILNDN
ncbi:pyruvate kinase [Clostridium algoriphilum]|uniref:pyruvate kinase n=1 Tax=Clostridium algoriphilum TaxID=198347 RepID=UPI001CF3D5A4|nr:pyruvate kinase [Clostridium algoriphilum]MCB2295143.1 pyruvate kinase [Clostridium algoriphilum]